VLLRTAEHNVERVRLRVAKGGHDVPEDKIRSRRERSFQQLPWFLDNSDFALLYDNSGASPKLNPISRSGFTRSHAKTLKASLQESGCTGKPSKRLLDWPNERWLSFTYYIIECS